MSDSIDDCYLAQARLPSNSGHKSIQLRLREVEVKSDDSILLVEVVTKGEMVERGKQRTGGFVTDFTIVCGVASSQADCTFAVDHSCLLELAEGLEHMSAFMHQA